MAIAITICCLTRLKKERRVISKSPQPHDNLSPKLERLVFAKAMADENSELALFAARLPMRKRRCCHGSPISSLVSVG
jgi:hypothetical protein